MSDKGCHWIKIHLYLGIAQMDIRAGPQSQNWSDQQNTLDPTGSVHKKGRKKLIDFDEGDCI